MGEKAEVVALMAFNKQALSLLGEDCFGIYYQHFKQAETHSEHGQLAGCLIIIV